MGKTFIASVKSNCATVRRKAQCVFFLPGFEWRERLYKLRCGKNGIEFMGCFTTSGVYIPNGEVKLDSNGIPEIQVRGRATATSPKCRDDEGQEKDQGSEWKSGALLFRCGRDGVELVGCFTKNGPYKAYEGMSTTYDPHTECRIDVDGAI
ncbi:hypothetical protein KIN20_006113 [Parelaphostrongylus tenuis]|uniref:Uncharacterized protein n=1 Tax=Parelaphostrongylus tenuis TaxID=148309 RepID=A0AAD5MM45_PARTN|nr:hypothetical protein KIN20_006113 [Parelaphostrongylus tenuis]